MKKFFLLVLFVLCFSITGNYNNFSISKTFNEKIENLGDDIWIEYVCNDGQWYKITHYPDGTIGTEPVPCPPWD